MDKSITQTRTINTSAWTYGDRENFRISVANLKAEIDNYLFKLIEENLGDRFQICPPKVRKYFHGKIFRLSCDYRLISILASTGTI